MWGRSWAEVVARARRFRLAAVVDAAAPARKWAQAEFGVPAFDAFDEALAGIEADAVVLVSPPSSHRALTEAAVARGLHVVTEKPIALDLADAKAMAKAGERAGVHVLVAQNYRFRRQSRALQQLVAQGALGELLGVRIACRRNTFNSFIAPGDWRARMAHPYLIDMAIHHIDMLRMITGLELTEVDARGWHVPDHPFEAEPTVEALITVADGTPVAYEGTLAAAGAPNVLERRLGARRHQGARNLDRRGRQSAARNGHPAALREIAGASPVAGAAGARPRGGAARVADRGARGAHARGQRRRRGLRVRGRARRRALDRRAAAHQAVKLGLFLALFHDRPLGEALAAAPDAGVEAVEISTTGPHGGEDVAAAAAAYGLEISALSCHANPLHPRREIAAGRPRLRRDREPRRERGRHPVIPFSGCPGDSETPRAYPNWVTCAWPDDYRDLLEWQWPEQVIPYWSGQAALSPRRTASGSASRCTRLRRLQPADAAPPARGVRRRDRRQPRSEPPVLAGDRHRDRHRASSAGRGDLPRPCQGHRFDRAARRSTASSTRSRRPVSERLGLPDGRLRPRRARLAADPLGAPAGRLRRRALDRARGCAAGAGRGARARGRDAPRRGAVTLSACGDRYGHDTDPRSP